jgi:outer membrane protein OmpA-like peptidoglycan-associated protein
MAATLVDSLQGLVTPQLLATASSRLDEPESAVSKGLAAAIPLILGGLIQKKDDPTLMSQVMGLLRNRAASPDALANPASVVPAPGELPTSGISELGSKLQALLFDTRTGPANSALAEYAGIKSTSASSLTTLAGAMVSGFLGDRVRRDGLNASGLVGLLAGQRDSILRALPSSLSGIAGLGALRDFGTRITGTARRDREESWAWVWPLAAALLIGLVLWSMWERRNVEEAAHTAAVRVGDAAGAAVDQGRLAIAKLGSFVPRKLPSNVELNVPEHGVEAAVIAYLDDPSRPVDPTTWFNFDRLLFETGSARLMPQSEEQLRNVAEIMKAYPSMKAKIGGYTDNVGDPSANLVLSQARATNVRGAIIALGIAPERLTAEGYGEQFPVASNATDDGRQQNRRIALHVTER